jgi:hypothetical protein
MILDESSFPKETDPSNCGIPFLYKLVLSMIYLSVVKLISEGTCSDTKHSPK